MAPLRKHREVSASPRPGRPTPGPPRRPRDRIPVCRSAGAPQRSVTAALRCASPEVFIERFLHQQSRRPSPPRSRALRVLPTSSRRPANSNNLMATQACSQIVPSPAGPPHDRTLSELLVSALGHGTHNPVAVEGLSLSIISVRLPSGRRSIPPSCQARATVLGPGGEAATAVRVVRWPIGGRSAQVAPSKGSDRGAIVRWCRAWLTLRGGSRGTMTSRARRHGGGNPCRDGSVIGLGSLLDLVEELGREPDRNRGGQSLRRASTREGPAVPGSAAGRRSRTPARESSGQYSSRSLR